MLHRLATNPFVRFEKLFLLDEKPAGGLPIHRLKSDFIARAKLSEAAQIRRNHIRDLGITAGGLLFHKQYDRQSGRRDLHGAQGDAFRRHLGPAVYGKRSSLKPKPHAIRLLRNAVGAAVEDFLRRNREQFALRSWRNTQHLAGLETPQCGGRYGSSAEGSPDGADL